MFSLWKLEEKAMRMGDVTEKGRRGEWGVTDRREPTDFL